MKIKPRKKPEEEDEPLFKPRAPKKPRTYEDETFELWAVSVLALIAGGFLMAFWPVGGAFVLAGGIAGFLWFGFGRKRKL